MKAAVLHGKEDVRLEEVPVPSPGPGEVLLKIQAALTCGTDLKVFRAGSHARMLQPPCRFGHEFAGIIESVGPEATGWRPGMRVVAANSAPCRICFYCRKAQENLCQDLLFVNGAYAEYLRLPARLVQENLLEIPPNLPFEAAALTEPLACVIRGVQAARPMKGETVAVLGSGPVALMFVQLLLRAGCRVILLGKGRHRLRIAQACGAETLFDLTTLQDPVGVIQKATPGGRGADLVVEAVGQPVAWSQALGIARPGGRVLLFGGCPSGTEISVDTKRFHYGELTMLSVFHHTPAAIRQAVQCLAERAIRPELLIDAQAPLQELPAILRRMLGAQDSVKTAIHP